MKNKVLLMLSDAMRADALAQCSHPFAKKLLSGIHTLSGTTVMPSVTLPCHMSMFHGVAPDRHGTTTNDYAPQVRPIPGLCEVLAAAGKTCAMVYDWENLRDLSRPGSLLFSHCFSPDHTQFGHTADGFKLTATANWPVMRDCLDNLAPDFAVFYMGLTDAAGHAYGWMSDEYFDALSTALDNMQHLIDGLEGYSIIVTTDHGGHDHCHGTEMPEDMTIPLAMLNVEAEAVDMDALNHANIIDIPHTVAAILGVAPDADWEGKPLVRR